MNQRDRGMFSLCKLAAGFWLRVDLLPACFVGVVDRIRNRSPEIWKSTHDELLSPINTARRASAERRSLYAGRGVRLGQFIVFLASPPD